MITLRASTILHYVLARLLNETPAIASIIARYGDNWDRSNSDLNEREMVYSALELKYYIYGHWQTQLLTPLNNSLGCVFNCPVHEI